MSSEQGERLLDRSLLDLDCGCNVRGPERMRRTATYIGTSGWSYDHWKGLFYPNDIPSRDMLRVSGEFEIPDKTVVPQIVGYRTVVG